MASKDEEKVPTLMLTQLGIVDCRPSRGEPYIPSGSKPKSQEFDRTLAGRKKNAGHQ